MTKIPRIGPEAIAQLRAAAKAKAVPKSHFGHGIFGPGNHLCTLLTAHLINWQDLEVPYEDRLLVVTDAGRAFLKDHGNNKSVRPR